MQILKNHDLELDRKIFYNFNRKEASKKLTPQEEMELIMHLLHEEGFHIRLKAEYTVGEDGTRTGRVVKALFFCSSEQIKLVQRFASGYCYITDATFKQIDSRCHYLSLLVSQTLDGHFRLQ